MRRYIMLMMAAVMLLSILAPGAYAEETEAAAETTEVTETVEETEAETTEATEEPGSRLPKTTSGKCGDNLTWALEGTTLTITGRGEMADGNGWAHLQDKVEKLVLKGGVTTVAEGAFRDFDALKEIDFGGSLVEIGDQAFLGCDGFESVSLPASFKQFGKECFRDCGSLKEIYCAGNMPHFRAYCLYNSRYITCFSVAGNPWPQNAIEELQQNMGQRYQFATSGEYERFNFQEPEAEAEPAVLTETEPEPQPVTEVPTEAPVTVPTVAPTEAPTEAPTIPTEAPAEEPTEVPTEETEPEGTIPVPAKNLNHSSWIGLALIIGVLTFLLIGALIVRGVTRKGGRYTE